MTPCVICSDCGKCHGIECHYIPKSEVMKITNEKLQDLLRELERCDYELFKLDQWKIKEMCELEKMYKNIQ